MSHMLVMPTGQSGDPVILFILVVSDYRLFHGKDLERPAQADQE